MFVIQDILSYLGRDIYQDKKGNWHFRFTPGLYDDEMVSMHEDIVDSDTYWRVLEFDILTLMNAFSSEKSVLISDNASVHNKAAIMTLCQSVGVLAIFLEPYSYDYNPIELVFHRAKDCLWHTWPSDDHNFREP